MKAPQIILIIIYAINLGIALMQHGTEKEGTNSFWVILFGTILNMGLLWWGGFFN